MADDRLYGATASKVFPGFAFGMLRSSGLWSTRDGDAGLAHVFSATESPVTVGRLRCDASDISHLAQEGFQCIPVIRVTGKTLGTNNDAPRLGRDNSGLGTEFVLFVRLTLADAGHVRFV